MGDYPVKVSVGLPVFNGEKYVAQAIESILGQTFTDFELIISDNGSTDRTQQILQDFALRDKRVRLFVQPQNIGGGPNFTFVLDQARGQYFKWMAHDDLCDPQFLEQCVEVLDGDPECPLCYSDAKIIDEKGEFVEVHCVNVDTLGDCALTRFSNLMLSRDHRCYEIFGLIRRDVLEQTTKMGNFAVADRVLLAQLAVRGPFRVLKTPLFVNRRHPEQFSLRMENQHEATVWFDPGKVGKVIFPEWKAFNEYRVALIQSPLSLKEKFKAHLHLLRYLRMYRHRMERDLVIAFKQWWRGCS